MADGTTFDAADLDQNEIIVLGERTGTLSITGKRNRVVIGEGARFDGCIEITGDDNLVEIGAWSTFNGAHLGIYASECEMVFGQTCGIAAATILMHEKSRVIMGNHCGLGAEVWMSTSDMHPIYDAGSGRRLNPARDITFGDHSGAAFRSIILKGSKVGAGCFIGAASLVRGRFPPNSLICGNPAKVMRKNIRWEWDIQMLSAPSNSGRPLMAA